MDPVTIRLGGDSGKAAGKQDVVIIPAATFRELKLAIVVLLLTLTYLLVIWVLATNHDLNRETQNEKQVTNIGLSVLDEDPIPDLVTFEGAPTLQESSETTTDSSEPRLTIEDIFLSVKTTKKFHRSRVDVILQTWFKLARDQVRTAINFKAPLHRSGHLCLRFEYFKISAVDFKLESEWNLVVIATADCISFLCSRELCPRRPRRWRTPEGDHFSCSTDLRLN